VETRPFSPPLLGPGNEANVHIKMQLFITTKSVTVLSYIMQQCYIFPLVGWLWETWLSEVPQVLWCERLWVHCETWWCAVYPNVLVSTSCPGVLTMKQLCHAMLLEVLLQYREMPHNVIYLYREILAAIKFGEMARNCFDKYLVNLKFGDSHDQDQIETRTACAYAYSHCRRTRLTAVSVIIMYSKVFGNPTIGESVQCHLWS